MKNVSEVNENKDVATKEYVDNNSGGTVWDPANPSVDGVLKVTSQKLTVPSYVNPLDGNLIINGEIQIAQKESNNNMLSLLKALLLEFKLSDNTASPSDESDFTMISNGIAISSTGIIQIGDTAGRKNASAHVDFCNTPVTNHYVKLTPDLSKIKTNYAIAEAQTFTIPYSSTLKPLTFDIIINIAEDEKVGVWYQKFPWLDGDFTGRAYGLSTNANSFHYASQMSICGQTLINNNDGTATWSPKIYNDYWDGFQEVVTSVFIYLYY